MDKDNENVVDINKNVEYYDDYQPTEAELKAEMFEKITENMLSIYNRKNKDYGDAFSESFREFGPTSAVIRIGDKYRRFKNLILKQYDPEVEESIEDTLIDMANYAIMTVIELERSF